MARKFYTGIDVQTDSIIRFYNTADTFFISLKAPAAQGSSINYVLPGTDTASGVMSTDGSGNLSLALLVNANVAAAAAIAVTKLAALTASRAVVSDGSGFLAASATTAAEIAFVNGVTSAIQTQLNGKASTALSNLTVASLAIGDLLVGSSGSAVVRLAVGTSGQVLQSNGTNPVWATIATVMSFKDTWITADTATKAIVHSLSSTDVQVQVFDVASGATIEVDVVRTDANTVTVTASEAPPAGNWRVLILAI